METTNEKKSVGYFGPKYGIMVYSTEIACGIIMVATIIASIPIAKWYAGLIGKSIAKELKA